MVHTQKQYGFTLQELLVGMALFFILTAIGVPSYINIARNGSRDNTTSELFSDMYYARSEAIKRSTTVSVCRTADPTVANPVCGGTAKDWSTGWLVFVDSDGDGQLNGTNTLLKVGTPANNRIQVMASAKNDAFIQYFSDGSLNTTNAPAQFAVCDDRDNDGKYDAAYGQYVTVEAMGRPEISQIADPSNAVQTCAP